jgi:hypothetical protein
VVRPALNGQRSGAGGSVVAAREGGRLLLAAALRRRRMKVVGPHLYDEDGGEALVAGGCSTPERADRDERGGRAFDHDCDPSQAARQSPRRSRRLPLVFGRQTSARPRSSDSGEIGSAHTGRWPACAVAAARTAGTTVRRNSSTHLSPAVYNDRARGSWRKLAIVHEPCSPGTRSPIPIMTSPGPQGCSGHRPGPHARRVCSCWSVLKARAPSSDEGGPGSPTASGSQAVGSRRVHQPTERTI